MQASQDDIDVSAMLSSIWRVLPRLLAVTGLVGALTFGVLMLVPPSYKSTSQIILQSSSSSLLRPSGEVGTGSDLKIDENEVASQAEVIRSRDLLTTVVAAQHLDQNPDFNPVLRPKSIIGRIIGLLNGMPAGADGNARALTVLEQNIRVGEVPKTRLINIDVTAHDAELAAELANAIAQAYLDRNRSAQVQDASDATTSIGASIAAIKQEAEAAESELERFRAESGLLSGQNKVTLNNQQLSELNTQLTQATAARTEAEARSRILRQMIASGHVEDSQEVVKSLNMQQLFQQKLRVERDIAELSATLLPGHPRMRQLSAELVIANDRLREQAKQVAVGIEDDLKVAAARESALQDSIAKLTETALKSSEAQAKLSSLEREAQSKRNTYDGLLQRLNEASSRRNSSAVSAMASLNERAVAASLPDSPKKTQMTIFAMLGTLLLGLVWMIARALMGGGQKSDPALSSVGAAKPGTAAPANAAASAIRLSGNQALAQFVADAARSGRGSRILLTGEAESQDLSGAATGLAAKLGAGADGVVLIDLTQQTVSGLPDPGLADLVSGKAVFEDVVRADAQSGWHGIGPGTVLVPAWGQMGGNLELVLEALAASYQHVIVAAGRSDAKSVLVSLDGQIDIGVICAAPGRPAGAGIDDGFLGYDVQDLALVWLENAKISARSVSRISAARLGPVPA